jgi:hypothetical protein
VKQLLACPHYTVKCHASGDPISNAATKSAPLCGSCHAGAATPDIISQYVGCIRALREVDPAGVLLNAVGGPIKAYLRSRRYYRLHLILAQYQSSQSYKESERMHIRSTEALTPYEPAGTPSDASWPRSRMMLTETPAKRLMASRCLRSSNSHLSQRCAFFCPP